jgi:hypothetical protein
MSLRTEYDTAEVKAIKDALINAIHCLEADQVARPEGGRKKVISQVRDTIKHVFGETNA